jgi:hypothetical protein
MCGASPGQKMEAGQEAAFANSLRSDFASVFANNEAILNSVQGALTPIVQAGENQFGMNPAEEAALRTQSMEGASAAGTNVSNAVNEALAAKGGGNTFMPAGSLGAIEEQIASETARQNAAQQLGITEKGYDIGRQDFFQAESALAGAPGALENPATSLAGGAIGAGNAAMSGANAVQSANMAPWQALGGAIGGAAGKLLGNPGLFNGGGGGGGDSSGGAPSASLDDLTNLGVASPVPTFST